MITIKRTLFSCDFLGNDFPNYEDIKTKQDFLIKIFILNFSVSYTKSQGKIIVLRHKHNNHYFNIPLCISQRSN
jgi:hypothetical protein